jgi:hypothetical protein
VVSPQLILQVGADSIGWYVDGGDYEALAERLSQAVGPVVVPVFGPLHGRLVVNPRSAGSVGLGVQGLDFHGTHPSDARLPGAAALLYVPTVTAPGSAPSGYLLPPDTDLAGLERQIVAAMAQGSVVSVPLSAPPGIGVLVLSGASLSYCVLCQPVPPGRPGG